MAIYLIPLMVGHAQHGVPAAHRLHATGCTCSAACCCGSRSSSTSGRTPAGSPTSRWPGPKFGMGKRADVWAQMVTFTEVAALAVAVTIDRDHPQAARAGDDPGADADLRLGDAGHLADGDLLDAGGRAGVGHAAVATGWSGPISSTPSNMATRCSGSTCSGSSATPRSTSSSCPRPASSARSSRPSRAGRCSAIRSSCCRWSAPGSSPSACGSTTCSRPACRASATAFYTAASMAVSIPTGHPDLLLDRDDVGRAAAASRCRCSASSASSSPSSSAGSPA